MIGKTTTYLEDNLQEMLTELEVDREDNNVLGNITYKRCSRSWKLIEKITTYLEDNLQEMLTELEVDREDNNVLGRCLTRDAHGAGS